MGHLRKSAFAVLLVGLLVSASVAPSLLGGDGARADPAEDPAVEIVATAEAAQNCDPDVEAHNLGFFSVGGPLKAGAEITKAGAEYVGCKLFDTDVNTTETDASQAKVDIYQSAVNDKSNAQVFLTGMDNYLEDTETVALVEGKNAYVRSLNEDNAKSAAEVDATNNISDYYSVKEYNLVQSWNNRLSHVQYLRGVASNESGVSTDFVKLLREGPDTDISDVQSEITSFGTEQITLQNGSTVQAQTVDIAVKHTGLSEQKTYTIGPKTGKLDGKTFSDSDGARLDLRTIVVQAPNSDYEDEEILEFQNYADHFSSIDTQTSDTKSQVTTFVESTYDQYQAGEINNSELVDPYMAQRDYSPNGSFEAWAITQLTMLGANSPESLDQVGHFEIATGANVYDGMLLSDESPASGKFEVGTTYNPANIGGEQYVVTESEMLELTDNFTVSNITNSDGENVQNVTVREIDYQTANITEYQELMTELETLRAEVEAREKRSDSGPLLGGLFGGGSWLPDLDLPLPLLIGVGLAGALIVLIIVGKLYLSVATAGRY